MTFCGAKGKKMNYLNEKCRAGGRTEKNMSRLNKFKAEIAKYPDYKEAFENKILEEKPANTYEVGKINDSIIASGYYFIRLWVFK